MLLDHGLMAGKPRSLKKTGPRRPPRKLFIGEWIRVLEHKQVEVVRATGINEGYLSALCSGKYNKRPSYDILKMIADFLGIPVDYFDRPPPDKRFLTEAAGLDPRVIARLTTLKH